MGRTLFALFAITGLAVGGWADVVVVTTDTTIDSSNASTFAGLDVTVRGCTVTINVPLALHSLVIERNAANQPGSVTHAAALPSGLQLTIATDLTIQGADGNLGASMIDARGCGYPAGNGPGAGASAGRCAGGAGYGGDGGDGYPNESGLGGGAYDSITAPTALGSGGGSSELFGAAVGGAGGGAIQITVGGTCTVDGAARADGNHGQVVDYDNVGGGGGAGGSIFLTVGTFSGAGTVSADGGGGGGENCAYGGGGGGGRIAIVYTASTFNGMLAAHGGCGYVGGGAGTVYVRAAGAPTGTVLVENAGLDGALTPLGSVAATVWIADRAQVYPIGASTFAGLDVAANGYLTHPFGQPGIDLHVAGEAVIEPGGTISLAGRGHPAGTGPGAGNNAGRNGGGAAHGGNGGDGYPNSGGAGGLACDSITAPTALGSGGGSSQSYGYAVGGAGGGAVRLTVTGSLLVNGTVDADGLDGQLFNSDNVGGGGGAGGSIYLVAGSFGGSGAMTARGGRGGGAGWSYGGGGGGGRIAIICAASAFGGTLVAAGAPGYIGGGAGTIYTRATGAGLGDLNLDNNSQTGARTPSLQIQSFNEVTIANGAILELNPNLCLTGNLLRIAAGGRVELQAAAHFGGVLVQAEGLLTHRAALPGFDLTVNGDLTVAASGAVDVSYLGHPAESGPGAGQSAPRNGGGAGHGGQGGRGDPNGGGFGGSEYDSPVDPTALGSGGGSSQSYGYAVGGAGGGSVRLDVTGTLDLDGTLAARGQNGQLINQDNVGGGGGSGGSIHVHAAHILGSGLIDVSGGDGGGASFLYGGGGAGGRVALHTPDLQLAQWQIVVGHGRGYENGADGTYVHVTDSISVSQQPVGGVYEIGSPVTLSITASTTCGTLHFQWRRGGMDLVDDPPHLTGTQTATLHIDAAATADAGDYDVWLTDDCGSLVSDVAHLSVVLRGDLNCDGLINAQDIDGFIDALFNLAAEYDAYLHSFPVYHPCSTLNADFSGDGLVNSQDIDGFINALFGG